MPSRAHGAIPLPVRSPLPSPPHWSLRPRHHTPTGLHTSHTSLPPPITSAALRLPEASTKAFECRASRKESASNRGIAADADRLRACLARASPLPWLLSSLPPVRQVVRDQKPVHIAEEAGEQSQEQGVEHVGQRQAFCNREKGGTARMVFARRLRLLHARSRCSAMNIIMLQVGCRSACTKINAWCCARWRARMSA